MDALHVAAVSKSFGGVQAVVNVDLHVSQGERRALIGPNGAGKTTLFNLITGEQRADRGTITIFGTDVTRASIQQRARLGLGRTYQISQLFGELTVEENLFLAAAAKDGLQFRMVGSWRNRKVLREWVRHVAEQVHLEQLLGVKVAQLSHGQHRQLEMGMALALRPRLVMLDEPAAGLSPPERALLTQLIKDIPRTLTLVIIEHDMDIVLEVVDQITVLHRGAVLAEGTPADIRANAEVQHVYLGGSRG